jgi:hypothetical protein
MNTLSEVLAQVIEKMKRLRSYYEQNEMAVREQIINPILRSLGWNPENPEEVRPNVSTQEGVPDYSLIKNEKTMLFLEAKKLGVDVEQRDVMAQLARYSFGEGTEYGILTNGAVWILIRSFEVGKTLTERIVWKVDLENEEPPSVARKISTISRSNAEQIQVLVRKAEILNEIWQSLLDEPEDMIKAVIPLVKSTIAQGYPTYQFQDTEIEDLLRERIQAIVTPSPEAAIPSGTDAEPVAWPKGESPQKMKLAGEVFELHNSYEILVNTANWLIKRGRLKASDCPVSMGHKRNLVNTQPKHKYGGDFVQPKKLSEGLWIEAHYSTAACMNNARRLLERFGASPDTLVIE